MNYQTEQLRALLRKKYAMPEYFLAEEVRDAAGFDGRRSVDALAMGMWAGRGLHITGFEIKSSRGDWLKEKKNPEKAEAINQYCDHWFIVASPDIVKLEELPLSWGLMVPNGNGLKVVKAAPKNEHAVPLTRSFVAAFIRRCGEFNERALTAAIADKLAEKERDINDRVKRDVEMRTRDYTELLAKLAKVKEETGIDLTSYRQSSADVSRAIKFSLTANLQTTYGVLSRLEHTLATALTETRNDMALLAPPTDSPTGDSPQPEKAL